MKHSRRKLIQAGVLGGIGLLAGCTDGQSPGNNAFDNLPQEPNDNPMVVDGELQYPQLIQAPSIRSFDSDTLSLTTRIMPNPVDDYEIEVYITPLSEYGVGWDKKDPNPNYVYDSTEEEWVPKYHSPIGFPDYTVSGHGTKIASRTIPSRAAGLSSGQVNLPRDSEEYERIKEMNESDELWKRSNNFERNAAFLELKQQMNLASIGDRWFTKDFYPVRGNFEKRGEMAEKDPVGSYLIGPANHPTRVFPHQLPQILDLDIDGENIPMHEPFVISIGVNDPNSVASRDDVIESTVQCMRVGEDDFVYPKSERYMRKEVAKGSTYSYKPQEWIEVEPEEGNKYGYESEWMDGDLLYNTIKQDESSNSRTWNVTRLTNLGRYSPKLDPHNEDYNVFNPAYMAYAIRPPYYLDTPYQNLWTIDYTITKEQIQELDEVTKSGNKVERWTKNSQVQEHPVIQDIARQLKNVCGRIDATETSEKVRVVADFVQYFTHRAEGTGVGYTKQLPAGYTLKDNVNPLRTLYEAQGDCVSFTILANTILRTSHFNMNPGIAHIEDTNVFTASGREIGHISTAISFDTMDADSVTDTEYQFIDSDNQYSSITVSDAQYTEGSDKMMYVELSSPYMLGSGPSAWIDGLGSYA